MWQTARFVVAEWKRQLPWREASAGAFQGFGLLTLAGKLGELAVGSSATDLFHSLGWLGVGGFGLGGLLWRVVQALPPRAAASKLPGRDVHIELIVGDLFALDGAIVVPCNTSFDTQLATFKNQRSIQSQFQSKFYDNLQHLDDDLQRALVGRSGEPATEEKPGKQTTYPIGTTAAIRAKGRLTYWLAASRINASGRAFASPEDIFSALPCFWTFVAEHGEKGTILMPVLGSGFARAGLPRERIVQEIVRSFIAANNARTFCDRLRIVIHPDDLHTHSLNFRRLSDFVRHECEFTETRSHELAPVGRALS